ncbi:glycine zipper domain-containing protein [Bosea sp. TAF32]|uniref:glycine zipper domain-containing protein n=1 Tax=Bosea sp. TAF32 TaxID=3237482 RepID=UPI003F8DBCB8
MATTTSAKRQAAAAAKRAKAEVGAGAEDVAAEMRQSGARATRQASALEDTLTRSAEEIAATVTDRLRAVGVDTDKMVDVAKEQATELQRLIEDEIRERPLRALGLAAAVGLFVGYLSAR